MSTDAILDITAAALALNVALALSRWVLLRVRQTAW